MTSAIGTGVFQPADVVLQRVIKHKIKTAAQDFMVGITSRQLSKGIAPENIKLPTDIGTLRDASVAWTVGAWEHLRDNPAIVLKAWLKCETGPFNLSWESLTSDAAFQNYVTLAATNPTIFSPALLSDAVNSDQEDIPEQQEHFDDGGDDTAVSVEELGTAILSNSTVLPGCAEDGDGHLQADEQDHSFYDLEVVTKSTDSDGVGTEDLGAGPIATTDADADEATPDDIEDNNPMGFDNPDDYGHSSTSISEHSKDSPGNAPSSPTLAVTEIPDQSATADDDQVPEHLMQELNSPIHSIHVDSPPAAATPVPPSRQGTPPPAGILLDIAVLGGINFAAVETPPRGGRVAAEPGAKKAPKKKTAKTAPKAKKTKQPKVSEGSRSKKRKPTVNADTSIKEFFQVPADAANDGSQPAIQKNGMHLRGRRSGPRQICDMECEKGGERGDGSGVIECVASGCETRFVSNPHSTKKYEQITH